MANKTAKEILEYEFRRNTMGGSGRVDVGNFVNEASRQLFEAEAALQEPLYRQVAGKPYATDGFKGLSNIYYERVDAIPIDKLRAFYGITETEQEAEE